jgi:rRNA-processing protein EBP2
MYGIPNMSSTPTTSRSKSNVNRKRPFQTISEPSEHEEDSGSDDRIDEEGMTKLMQALGEDGLDKLGIAHLRALGGSDGGGETLESDDEGGESDDMESVGVEELEGESASEEQDSERPECESGDEENDPGVALEDVESADEDAVPQQKIEIDNKVSS